jgi:single-strand DNA-binding protein
MSDMNTIVLSGRVVADPEAKFTAKGTAVTSLRLASTHYYKSAATPEGKFEEDTLFISVELFGKMAERVAERHKKGDLVMIRGRLSLNEWTAQDGTKKQTYRIHADQVNSLGPRRDRSDASDAPQSGASVDDAEPQSRSAAPAARNANARPAHMRGSNSSQAAAATGTHGAATGPGVSSAARAMASAPVEDLPF